MAFITPSAFCVTNRSPRSRLLTATSTRRPLSISCVNSPPQPSPPSSFSIEKTVFPADTDYSSALWHGSYIHWIEEARVRYLSFRQLPYEQLVNEYNTELIVRDVNIRYMFPLRLGDRARVTIRLEDSTNKVRISILSQFIRAKDDKICATAQVTIVPIDTQTGAIRRRWPEPLKRALLDSTALP